MPIRKDDYFCEIFIEKSCQKFANLSQDIAVVRQVYTTWLFKPPIITPQTMSDVRSTPMADSASSPPAAGTWSFTSANIITKPCISTQHLRAL